MSTRSVLDKKHCFIVEDNDLLASILSVHLADQYGLECTVFETADGALFEMMSAASLPALVVTDHLVPGDIKGVELASMVHSKWPGVAVILTSGYAYDLESTLPPNAMFISKPWSFEDFDQVMSRLAFCVSNVC